MNTQRRVVLKKSKDGLQDIFEIENNVCTFFAVTNSRESEKMPNSYEIRPNGSDFLLVSHFSRSC